MMKPSESGSRQWETDFLVRKRHIEASDLEITPNVFDMDNLASAGIFSLNTTYNHVASNIANIKPYEPPPISSGLLYPHSNNLSSSFLHNIPAHLFVIHAPEGVRLLPPEARNNFLPSSTSHQPIFLEEGEIDDQGASNKKKRKSRRMTNDLLVMSTNGGITVVSAINAKSTSLCQRKFIPLIGKGRTALSVTCSLPTMVPSHDIRQRYMSMWGNVFNIYDLPLLISFLDKHTRGDVIMTKHFPFGGASLLSFPEKQENIISVTSKRQLLLHWAAVLLMSPDQVVRHDYVKIEARNDGVEGSLVHCRLGVTGTLPFQSTQEEIMKILSYDVSAMALQGSSSSGKESESVSDVDFLRLLSSYTCPMLPVLADPCPLLVVGSFTFVLDGDKRIERMDYYLGPDVGGQHRGYFDDSADD
jgi:hypothetical protein